MSFWQPIHIGTRKLQQAYLQVTGEDVASLIAGAEAAPECFEQNVRHEVPSGRPAAGFQLTQHQSFIPNIRSVDEVRLNAADALPAG